MCRQLSSDLANFETPEEINVVAKGMREQGLSKIYFIETSLDFYNFYSAGSNWFWVGASNAHGDFRWTNGQEVNASLWSAQQSPESRSNREHCSCLFTKEETMFSFACSESAYVLCELPPGLAASCFI